MLLAGGRTEPRQWIHFNGANVLSLIAFALMRRGTELFMKLPTRDREQALMLLFTGGVVAALGPGTENASWRTVLTYGGQAYILLRTMATVRRPMAAEFGRGALLGIVGPGLVIGAMLATLSIRQILDFAHPVEMQRNSASSYDLMYYYLGGVALFNFGFMVMLTQRLVLDLRHASRRDPLTGLYNRRAIEEQLRGRWDKFSRKREPLALLLVDVDHFKQINDTLGHAAGDQVLAQLAAQLQRQAAGQAVARIGGEEFLLLADAAQAGAALAQAEALRERVAGQDFDAGGRRLKVSVSIGVALAGTDDADVDALMARADRALYRAKAAGRNRSEMSEPAS